MTWNFILISIAYYFFVPSWLFILSTEKSGVASALALIYKYILYCRCGTVHIYTWICSFTWYFVEHILSGTRQKLRHRGKLSIKYFNTSEWYLSTEKNCWFKISTISGKLGSEKCQQYLLVAIEKNIFTNGIRMFKWKLYLKTTYTYIFVFVYWTI